MTPAASTRWRPVYDAGETLEHFVARQREAFAAFERAWRDGRVSLKLKAYYDQVVHDVGANAYAWWRQERWADVFKVSTSTIKRVLAALVKAGLIRRERAYGTASRTYVTAYDSVVDEGTSVTDNHCFHLSTAPSISDPFSGSHQPTPPQCKAATSLCHCTTFDQPALKQQERPAHRKEAANAVSVRPASADVEPSKAGRESSIDEIGELDQESGIGVARDGGDHYDYRQSSAPSFGLMSDPMLGSCLVPDSVKSRHPTIGAAGGFHPAPAPHPVVQRLLEREGVSDFVLAAQLLVQPMDELHAVSQYLDTQHTVRDRPRLFAWLATHGFGGQLLAGRGRHATTTQRPSHAADRTAARRSAHDRRVPAAAVDWVAHVCPRCQVHYVEEAGTPCFDCTVPPAAAALLPPVPDPAPSRASATPLPLGDGDPGRAHQAAWEQVRAMLDADAACSDLALWLDGSVLLDVHATTAILGVPNVFMRDELEQHHAPVLEAMLATALGRTVTLAVVVDGSCS